MASTEAVFVRSPTRTGSTRPRDLWRRGQPGSSASTVLPPAILRGWNRSRDANTAKSFRTETTAIWTTSPSRTEREASLGAALRVLYDDDNHGELSAVSQHDAAARWQYDRR